MLKNYTLSLNAEEMELFRLKHHNVSYALRQLIKADVKANLVPGPLEQSVLDLPKERKCGLTDIDPRCSNCPEPDCPGRLAPYDINTV